MLASHSLVTNIRTAFRGRVEQKLFARCDYEAVATGAETTGQAILMCIHVAFLFGSDCGPSSIFPVVLHCIA